MIIAQSPGNGAGAPTPASVAAHHQARTNNHTWRHKRGFAEHAGPARCLTQGAKTPSSPRLLGLAALLCATTLTVGCAGGPQRATSDLGLFSPLYDGKSNVAHGTLLPVTSAAEALQRGDAALAEGDVDKALFEYIRALDFDDHRSVALTKIGAIHGARDNDRLAEVAYRGALNEDPDEVRALTELGVLLLERRDYAEARQHLQRALSINGELWRAHNALGVIADLSADYAVGQRHYEQALQLTPGNPEILNNLGYSRYLSGDWGGAIAAFREALLSDPRYARAWRNLALVYARQERYTDAIESLAKIQEMPKAYNDVGYLAMLAGELDQAETLFAEAKRLSPHFYAMADTNQRRVELMKGQVAAP